MGAKTRELIDVLHSLAQLLQREGDTRWQEWAVKSRDLLLASDGCGIDHFLMAFGGIGSINDLILGARHDSAELAFKPGYVEINKEFQSLLSKAYDLAAQIKREL